MTNGDHDEGSLILVGVDGSSGSKAALRWAERIRRSTGGRIEAVAVWHMPPSFDMSVYPPEWDPEADAHAMLERSVGEVFPGHAPVDLDLVVRSGRAAQVLVEESGRATVMVLGRRGHGGFPGLNLGSVSNHCVAHAHCPVLVVHAGDREPAQT